MKTDALTRRILIGLGTALVVGLLAYWFLSNFELQDKERRTGYSPEALRNPLLAAERFLRKAGMQVKSIRGRDLLKSLPPPDDTLVIYRFGTGFSPAHRAALQRWMNQGGHLILDAPEPDLFDEEQASNALLAGFGVENQLADAADMPSRDGPYLVDMEFEDYAPPLQIAFDEDYYLVDGNDEASGAVMGELGYHLLQFDVGEGMLTVTSDSRFLSNRRIGKHDHALFLALLAEEESDSMVWLLYDSDMPDLFSLLWRNAPYLLISLFVLLAFALWRQGRRLGPLLPVEHHIRRDLREHLEANAGYFWRRDRGRGMFRTTQIRVARAWERKHLALRTMNETDKCAWIAARTGLSADDVRRALFGNFASEAEFVELSAHLQTLGSNLTAGTNPS